MLPARVCHTKRHIYFLPRFTYKRDEEEEEEQLFLLTLTDRDE